MNIGTNGVINTILRWVAGTGEGGVTGTGGLTYNVKILEPSIQTY